MMKIEIVSKFAEIVSAANEFMNGRKFLWRGHSDSNWKFHSSIKRYFDNNNIGGTDKRRELEQECISVYLDLDEVATSICSKFLAMTNLQHFGCPTRLIDFTHSLYIALFFALRDEGTQRVIFGIEEEHLEENTMDVGDGGETHIPNLPDRFLKMILEDIGKFRPFPIHYAGNDQRFKEQKSVFLFEVNIDAGSDEYFRNIPDEKAIEIRFSSSLDKEIISNLKMMNVDGIHLFEGKVGFAEHSKWALGGRDSSYGRSPQSCTMN